MMRCFFTIPESAYDQLTAIHPSLKDATDFAVINAPKSGPYLVIEATVHARVKRDPDHVAVEKP